MIPSGTTCDPNTPRTSSGIPSTSLFPVLFTQTGSRRLVFAHSPDNFRFLLRHSPTTFSFITLRRRRSGWGRKAGSVSNGDFSIYLRDWSLITGRRGGCKMGGWHVKFYPYEKGGGAEKVLAMLKRGRGAQQVLR